MSSRTLSSTHMDARQMGQASLVMSLALSMIVAGGAPAGAQQRIEITTKRVREVSDTVRKLQRTLDSLSHVYNEDEQLSAAQRRRVEGEIRSTVDRLEEVSIRINGGMLAPSAPIGVRMGAAAAERAAQDMSRALMQVREFEQARPRGWIGFVAQGPGLEPRIEDGELIVRYFSYPRILSVDPSSPAQRAGIATDDTLLAYDGRDVRDNDISLTRLLRPNARVRVRVLRDGRVHEIPVTVAAVPSGVARRRGSEMGGGGDTWEVPNPTGFPRIAIAPPPPGAARGAQRVSIAAAQGATPAPSVRNGPTIYFGVPSNAPVAGAQMATISRDLGEAIGQLTGVLVTNAPLGSPANESGLRDGDVIVKVAGQVVRSVTEVRELVALANNEGHTVDVDILRQKRPMRIVLRW